MSCLLGAMLNAYYLISVVSTAYLKVYSRCFKSFFKAKELLNQSWYGSFCTGITSASSTGFSKTAHKFTIKCFRRRTHNHSDLKCRKAHNHNMPVRRTAVRRSSVILVNHNARCPFRVIAISVSDFHIVKKQFKTVEIRCDVTIIEIRLKCRVSYISVYFRAHKSW
jgi:hypothetical protein